MPTAAEPKEAKHDPAHYPGGPQQPNPPHRTSRCLGRPLPELAEGRKPHRSTGRQGLAQTWPRGYVKGG